MDAALFTKMLSDKNVLDLRKLGYQFPQADIKEFTELLKNGFYHSLPLKDFSGHNIVYLSSIAQVRLSAAKVLLTPHPIAQRVQFFKIETANVGGRGGLPSRSLGGSKGGHSLT